MDGEDSSRASGEPGLQPGTLPSTHPGAPSSQDGASPGTSNESSPATTSDSRTSSVPATSATTTPDSDASGPSPTSSPATPAAVAPASPPAAPAPQPAAPAAQPTAPASQPAVPAPTPATAAPPPQPAATAAGPRKVLGPIRPAKKLHSKFASIGRALQKAQWLVDKPDDEPSSNDQLRTRRSRSTMDSPELRPCTPSPVPHPPALDTSPSSSPQRTGSLTRRVSDWYSSKKRKVPREETDSDSPAESSDAQSTRRRSEDQNRVHKFSLLKNGAGIRKYIKNQDREAVQ